MTQRTMDDTGLGDLGFAFARIVIGSYFIAKSCGLVFDPYGLDQLFNAGLIPATILWTSLAFEFCAAFCIMVGYHTRVAALVLGIHVFWTSFVFNYDPSDQIAISLFWKDLALIGGLIMITASGGKRFALQAPFGKRRGQQASLAPAKAATSAAREGHSTPKPAES